MAVAVAVAVAVEGEFTGLVGIPSLDEGGSDGPNCMEFAEAVTCVLGTERGGWSEGEEGGGGGCEGSISFGMDCRVAGFGR